MQFAQRGRWHNCPYCGSAKVRHSQRKGLFELLVLRLVLMRPYRCKDCGQRFYSLRAKRSRDSS